MDKWIIYIHKYIYIYIMIVNIWLIYMVSDGY